MPKAKGIYFQNKKRRHEHAKAAGSPRGVLWLHFEENTKDIDLFTHIHSHGIGDANFLVIFLIPKSLLACAPVAINLRHVLVRIMTMEDPVLLAGNRFETDWFGTVRVAGIFGPVLL